VDPKKHIISARITEGASTQVIVDNFSLLTEPKNLALPPTRATVTCSDKPRPDGSFDCTITVAGGGMAVWVTLTTLADGRFSDNAMILNSGTTVVQFIPFAPNQSSILLQSIRVEHAASYV
jgi:beta-mannosidase